MRITRFFRSIFVPLLVLLIAIPLSAQTYRGGIGGTVTDATGAVVSGATVTLTNNGTGATRETTSTSAGTFVYQDLDIGTYTLTVKASGFGDTTLKNVSVNPGAVTPVEPKLSVSGTNETVDVSTDTTSTIQILSSANNAVVGQKAVSEIPLNGRSFTQLLTLTPGYNASGSLNGSRSNQLNYQIDGADNNDIWQGGTAANQGGVGSIAGVTLPIDAIDQFTVQSSGNAEEGHSAGGLVTLSLKTGTNAFHGGLYFYGRSEFFAARDFFATDASRKQKVRNQQFGGSIGGPIIKDKLFFFGNYERQVYNIQLSSTSATEPGAAYVTLAQALLTNHGVTPSQRSPLSSTLLTALWPGGNQAGLASTIGNYVETHQRHGYSDNFVGNINYVISPKQTLRLQSFVGTGRQAEPGGPTYWYFQVAPDITQNFSLTHNWAPTERLSNQLLVATGIFNQTFNDLRHDFNMPALGLNTGVTNPNLFGAPTITLTGFDGTGATQPLGRKDYTGHITDSATWVKGAHQLRFGGEFRRSYIDLQYQSGVRGNFTFNGLASNTLRPSGSGWTSSSSTATVCKGEVAPNPCNGINDSQIAGTQTEILSLADYLMGYYNAASFTTGNLRRDLYRTDMSFFIQDQYKLTQRLTLNYGVRHEFFGNLTTTGPWSVWRPGAAGADANGLIQAGTPGAVPTYKPGKLQFSPRVGFAWNPIDKLAVRGSYGLYFDSAPFNGFGNNSVSFATGANATGLQANPFGGVGNVSLGVGQWQANQYVWASASAPSSFGLFSVDPNLKTAYSHTYNLTTEYQLSNRTVVTLGYAGSGGVHLYILRDANQAAPWSTSVLGTTTAVTTTPNTGSTGCANPTNRGNANCLRYRRPYYSSYQNVGAVVQASSNAASNYNSLQATIKTSGFHGLTGQLAWTYAHSLDNGSGFRSTGPTNSNNLSLDWGNATFDIRHTLTGYVVYEAPQIYHAMPVLTKGWQVTGNVQFRTATPFSITVGDNTGIGMNKDRVNYNGGAYKTGSKTIQSQTPGSPTSSKYIQMWAAGSSSTTPGAAGASFTSPAAGAQGNTARDQFRGWNFFTTDVSLVKNTKIKEKVTVQFRAEMYNLFNFLNPGNPTTTVGNVNFGRSTSAPTGISAGAPFNVQFAGRLSF